MSDADARVALQRAIYQSRNATRRYLHDARRRWLEARIAAREDPVVRALEVGPGSGIYLPALAAVATEVLAMDCDAAYLRAARTVLAAQGDDGALFFLSGDLRLPPLADGSVDLLLCTEVLEHVTPGPQLLEGLARLLRSEGEMLLTTPQPYSPLELLGKIAFLPGIVQLLRLIYREPIEPTGHCNLMGRKALMREFEGAGLEVLEHHCLGLYLPIVGEFGGRWGQRFLAWLEPKLRATPLQGLLWTQCYRLRRRAS